MIYDIPRKIRRINRLRKMAAIFVKYQVISAARGLSALNPVTLISGLLGHQKKIPTEARFAILLRRIITDLGTTYIKFGQWLSVRPDMVPPEFLEELEKLQDRLPPVPFKTIQRTIERETGKTIDELFYSLDRIPISTASIAQVHRGVLKTGEEVAVKVQHPNLKRLVRVDVDIMRQMAAWAERQWPHLAMHRLDDALLDFKATLMDEMDFNQEAKNQDVMSRLFEDTPWIHIPGVYWEYTTERLLVMDYLDGVKITQEEDFQSLNLDRSLVTRRLSKSMFRQVFEFGFLQSDPHPGNVLFMRNNELGLVDFGIVERFDEVFLHKFADWMYAGIYRDADLFARTFLDISKALAPVDIIQFRTDCMDYLDEAYYHSVDRVSSVRLMAVCNRIQYRYKISTPPSFLSIFKSISTLEGLISRINPAYDWRKDWGPGLKKVIEDRYAPGTVIKKYWKILNTYDRLIADFPEDLRDVMQKIKEGKLEIQVPELREHGAAIQKGLQKIAISVVVSAVVFGLFYAGREQGTDFLYGLIGHGFEFWWAVLLLLLTLFYLRKL